MDLGTLDLSHGFFSTMNLNLQRITCTNSEGEENFNQIKTDAYNFKLFGLWKLLSVKQLVYLFLDKLAMNSAPELYNLISSFIYWDV